MEVEKQRLLLSCLASNRDLLAVCSGILNASYFDPSLKKSTKFLLEYFDKYRDVPKLATIRAETGAVLEEVGEITRSEIKYVSEEIEVFCRNKAVEQAILSGPELIRKGDYNNLLNSLKNAITVGLQQDLGMDYFQDPAERLRQTLINRKSYSTGWSEVDAMLGGGLGRQELLLITANSGGGKSMTMLNLANNFLLQGLNGLYISLEMAEGVVSKRLDSMISRIAQTDLLNKIQQVATIVESAGLKMGKFRIKRMPENRTNINHIRSYVEQLEQSTGFIPDFIIVDYIDIMGTTASISLDNLFIKDKYVTEEVRSLGFDFDCMMISASQLGRGAIEADKLNQSHIQGGISKINTADYALAVKQDDLMRAAGEIYFECLKARNSGLVGTRVLMGWDPISLLVSSLKTKQSGLVMPSKSSKKITEGGTMFDKPKDDGGEILNLMNFNN